MAASDWETLGTIVSNDEKAVVKRIAEFEGRTTSNLLRTLLIDYAVEKSTSERQNDEVIIYDEMLQEFSRVKKT